MKVSVITACFNSVSTIRDTIESVLSQDYSYIEYIIIDGASTDGTTDIINFYKDKISTFISEPDQGIYDALNKGINLATGDIIGFLHADDVYTNNKVISKVVSFLNQTRLDGCYGDLVYVNKNNINQIVRYWRSGDYRKQRFKTGWMPPHPTLFLKKSIYEKYGLFNEKFQISADYEFIIRTLYKNNVTVGYIPEVLVKMRLGGESNRNIKSFIRTTIEDYKAWKYNDLSGGFFAILFKKIRKFRQFRF